MEMASLNLQKAQDACRLLYVLMWYFIVVVKQSERAKILLNGWRIPALGQLFVLKLSLCQIGYFSWFGGSA
jgi:hypothetical protein